MIEINWDPSQKELRFFAGGLTVLICISAAFGASAWNWPGWAIAAVAAIAAVMAGLALFRTDWIRPIYLVWTVALFPIGWTVSHAVLALVYFAVFLPIGLLLRVRGYDPLLSKPKPPGESYWLERKPVSSRERYFRQY